MNYQDLGFTKKQEKYGKDENLDSFLLGRIISEHKERYVLKTPETEYEAELLGNLRYTAESRYDLPAVGDWVAFSEYDEGKGLIHTIYPRFSLIERKAVGKSGQIQLIASNIDYGLIVQAVNRDFNLNRIERYLTICNSSRIEAIVVLTKVDLISEEELNEIVKSIENRQHDLAVICVSNQTIGYENLAKEIQKGKTYCLLGSSGVGKSTILNNLSGEELMKTGEISTSVNKGRHITSHRELIVLESGGIIIDNPGMREVGITDSKNALESTFDVIYEYSQNCKYADCTHTQETGCAVLEAVENGEIDESEYSNYLKMEKERIHFESDQLERKKKDKELGKVIKQFQKGRKQKKF